MLSKKQRTKAVPGDNWKQDSMQRVERNYNIVHEGILSKKDFTSLFETGDNKYYIPANTTKRIDVYNEVTLSGGFLTQAAQQGIDVAIYDKFGNLLGTYESNQNLGSAETMIRQVNLYQNPVARLEIAKRIELAAFSNMRKNVTNHFNRTHLVEVQEIRQYLNDICSQIKSSTDIDNLMLVEAQGRQQYYRFFDYAITNPRFPFVKRSKRPPENEVNAMISFGNTLMYNRLALEISRTSLDNRIGVIHAVSARRNMTLSLDLAEIYKPLIVDPIIFRLVNNQILDTSWDFTPGGGGIYLSDSGKTKFIEAFNSALLRSLTVDGKKITYAQLIRREVRNYRSFILHGTPYNPYH